MFAHTYILIRIESLLMLCVVKMHRKICDRLAIYFSIIESIVVNYGRGSSPILPFRIDCSVDDIDISDCITTALNVSQCPQVAGVNCGGQCSHLCTLHEFSLYVTHLRIVAAYILAVCTVYREMVVFSTLCIVAFLHVCFFQPYCTTYLEG